MTSLEQISAIASALRDVNDVKPSISAPLGRAVFVGSGDSLSSALLAAAYGHRALSSGDLTWTGRLPFGTDTVVGISHSGTSGATVRALRLAAQAGKRTIAITSNADSPLAAAAAETQLVPSLGIEEVIPCAGHLMLGLGVAAVAGEDVDGAASEVARSLESQEPELARTVQELPAAAPYGISVLTLPDLRGAGDFWMLKLIEAVGVNVRAVPLEESGHVDYFIGPEPHLVLQLVGAVGRTRFERLAVALESTGQTVRGVVFTAPDAWTSRSALVLELAGAAAGAVFAGQAAQIWGRPPFRGGAVNMDARHIKLDDEPVTA
ncbi:SIS domain-containing protein [Kribbella sp. NBC_00662]|uniref:SIS domain-containing protein n=1 Tax=Kribbella sp. NBC_00662 TaxID=2975969 RepID=UPI00324F6616